jgi:drug/metabolite transporter (DMT)-like permease
VGVVVALPIVWIAGLPPVAAMPYLVASTVIHLGYYAALAGAYKHGDLGMTYPIMRGTAPMLVAMGSGTLLAESVSVAAWFGVSAICSGVILLGLKRSTHAAANHRSALIFALVNTVVIASYTFVDGLGVRAATQYGGNTLQYVSFLFLANGAPYFAWVMWRRSSVERAESFKYMKARWPLSLLGAAASLASYGIALWAMTKAPIAVVAALREVSVLFAALIGSLVLKEAFGIQRGVGTLLILGGVAALRLS